MNLLIRFCESSIIFLHVDQQSLSTCTSFFHKHFIFCAKVCSKFLHAFSTSIEAILLNFLMAGCSLLLLRHQVHDFKSNPNCFIVSLGCYFPCWHIFLSSDNIDCSNSTQHYSMPISLFIKTNFQLLQFCQVLFNLLLLWNY